MAIRYSGDCEIRIDRKGGRFHVRVRGPDYREAFVMSRADSAAILRRGRDLSTAYDRVALGALHVCLRKRRDLPVQRQKGTPTIARLFQAPCPVGT